MHPFKCVVFLILICFFGCNHKSDDSNNPSNSFSPSDIQNFLNAILEFNDVTHASMAVHYDSLENEFLALQDFIHKNLDDSTGVEIEFTDENELNIFHLKNGLERENHWNISRKSDLYDSLLLKLNWNDSLISILYSKLKILDCISISSYSKNQTQFGYKRDGMGKYSYTVHKSPLDSVELDKYWRCNSIFYRDNVVFNYGSGAIGSDCFPEKFIDTNLVDYAK